MIAEQASVITHHPRPHKERPPRKPSGRPAGSGATTIRLVAPAGGSGRLYIGRALWQAIGAPARVRMERFGARVTIKPTGETGPETFAVSGRASNSIPRLSIGLATMEQIGLDAGVYTAHVVDGKQTIVVDGQKEG